MFDNDIVLTNKTYIDPLLEIPIPLCEKHQHNGKPFVVETYDNKWRYIAIPTKLGSLCCRECRDELNCPQPYMRNIDLNSLDLNHANLRSGDFSYAGFCSSHVSYADLSLANFNGANFSYADLNHSDLHSSNLSRVDFYYTDLSHTDLSYTNLFCADLRYANLDNAYLSGADIRFIKNADTIININKAFWNKHTIVNKKFKKLLNKKRFLK